MNDTQVYDKLAQDHDRLDELLASFREGKRPDFAKAKEAFQQFKVGLQRHILWEERVLFPLFEEKTGMHECGPTVVMRAEHRRIGACLEALHEKIRHHQLNTDDEEQRLYETLVAHNCKEEQVLYPALDRLLTPGEKEAAFQVMKGIPEEEYRLCCGHR